MHSSAHSAAGRPPCTPFCDLGHTIRSSAAVFQGLSTARSKAACCRRLLAHVGRLRRGSRRSGRSTQAPRRSRAIRAMRMRGGRNQVCELCRRTVGFVGGSTVMESSATDGADDSALWQARSARTAGSWPFSNENLTSKQQHVHQAYVLT